MNPLNLFQSLRNPVFARLYAAQTTSLLGDAVTWVGLALLAFEIAGQNSAVVLASALTLRVTTFVLLSPLVGAITDRYDRKCMMVVPHLVRMSRKQSSMSISMCMTSIISMDILQKFW
jgi:NRE family putative nickel resistance protein-like MFS transporter